ncbi:MAG: hypothetical protein R2834_17115 [Rhodothermales bacterium]
MMHPPFARALLTVCLFMAACATPAREPIVTPLPNPAPAGSRTPNLATGPDGTTYLTWQRSDSAAAGLYFAPFIADAWQTPAPIAAGVDAFVNWADFPALAAQRDGRLLAHYLDRQPAGGYAYDIALVHSRDRGASWSAPTLANTDGTPTEHGFVSILPWETDGFFLTWLDGRQTGGEPAGAMSLRAAFTDADGRVTEEVLLDDRTCDCCQTGAAWTGSSLIVVYRDRSDAEVRDIYYTRLADGDWSAPAPVHRDGWEIEGCPVNGPVVDGLAPAVVAAWFTAAGDAPKVLAAVSTDDGISFADPLVVDDASPIGRVAIRMLDARSAMVVWLARSGDEAMLTARVIAWDAAGRATAQPAFPIAPVSAQRNSGFPRLADAGDRLMVAWTDLDASGATSVRTALIDRP